MEIQIYDSVENIVGKGEIARYEQFLLFPPRFQKLSIVDVLKRVSMEQRVKQKGACGSLKGNGNYSSSDI